MIHTINSYGSIVEGGPNSIYPHILHKLLLKPMRTNPTEDIQDSQVPYRIH